MLIGIRTVAEFQDLHTPTHSKKEKHKNKNKNKVTKYFKNTQKPMAPFPDSDSHWLLRSV